MNAEFNGKRSIACTHWPTSDTTPSVFSHSRQKLQDRDLTSHLKERKKKKMEKIQNTQYYIKLYFICIFLYNSPAVPASGILWI